ncbi:MAG: L-serine ammonia-lyase, iron-sulfur-dependent subunit beta [Treponemataceae bacterium]
MDIFDIIGPIMVGPSSSHTAGAARIGYVAFRLLGEKPKEARVLLHGSFARTGLGHGTNRAIVAGVLGMRPDDPRLKNSLEIAETKGLAVSFEEVELDEVHPNTAIIYLTGISGKKKMLEASSIGGGNIQITKIDGHKLSISGRSPTIIVTHKDIPGTISSITRTTGETNYNIFQINIGRDKKGGTAIMTLELDGNYVMPGLKDILMKVENVLDVIILQPF